jgi:asparagine synthase (glutamine-hydrolysing)
MRHRGPDDEGYLESGPAEAATGRLALGMRRLSIIDLAGGHQPIFNEDGRVGVVLNGEIYNFQELQLQLRDRGHTFRTRSDSEVVAHAYEEWGADCVTRLEGMFAFAVYDRRSADDREAGGSLFLARDRLGIKPLYYAAVSNQQSPLSKAFVFASEVRTLLASGLVPRRLSRPALESYLLFGSVGEPMTLIEGVVSLPPGHHLTIGLGRASGAPRIEQYWNIATQAATKGQKSENGRGSHHFARRAHRGRGRPRSQENAAAQVRELLTASVRKHLIADVPVGVFLSSGIDSTALAALASREVSGVHTFTVAFPEQEFSEAVIARRTARRLGTTHQEVMLSAAEMLARLGGAVGALDQPSIDGINTYLVSWSARQAGLKVALSGLGGDEVFGGYATFSRTAQYQRLASVGSRVPAGVRSVMATMVRETGGRFIPGDAARKLASLWAGPNGLPDAFYFGRTLFPPAQVEGLMTSRAGEDAGAPGSPENGNGKSLWWNWLAQSAAQAATLDPFAAVSCLEAQSYLVNTLLRDTDSMSMAHSLEVRVPFLDHALVEFVTQLRPATKLRKGIPKALLVAALDDLLPSEIVRQTKRGFTLPWSEWLRGPLKQRVEHGFAEMPPALQSMLHTETVRGVWQSYLDGGTSWSRPWSLFVLNEWVKKHLG